MAVDQSIRYRLIPPNYVWLQGLTAPPDSGQTNASLYFIFETMWLCTYSTVTLLARLRGWSTSLPNATALW